MARLNYEGFGGFLKGIRKEVSLTQQELARVAHFDVETISKWEREISSPNGASMTRLATAFSHLGIDLSERLNAFLLTYPLRREVRNGDLKRRVRSAALRASVGIRDLASTIGVREGTLRSWLDRGHVSSNDALVRLAMTLDVSPAYLKFGPDDPMPSMSSTFFSVVWIPQLTRPESVISKSHFIAHSDKSAIDFFESGGEIDFRVFEGLPALIVVGLDPTVLRGRLDQIAELGEDVRFRVRVEQAYADVSPDSVQRLLREARVGLPEESRPDWGLRSGNLFQILSSTDLSPTSRDGDDVDLRQRPSAFQFAMRDDRVVASAVGGTQSGLLGEDLRAELLEKIAVLRERLERTQSPSHVLATIDRLTDALASRFEDIKPGILLSRSRSIEAVVAVYETEEARRELFPDAQTFLRDVAESLGDLRATIPELATIEANRIALQLTESHAAEAMQASIEIIQIAETSDAVDASAVAALNMTSDDIAETVLVIDLATDEGAKAAAYEQRVRLIAQRLLDVRNFAARTLSAAQSQIVHFGREAIGSARKGALSGIEDGTKEATKMAMKGALIYLAGAILGPLAALALFLGSFGSLSRKAGELKDAVDAAKSERQSIDDRQDNE